MLDDTPGDGHTTETLKARRRSSKGTTGSKQQATPQAAPEPAAPEPAAPEPAPADSGPGLPGLGTSSPGISHHSLGGPVNMVGSFTSEGVTYGADGDYVIAEQPGYYAYYEHNARQPTVILAWPKGGRVRRDYYQRYGGPNAASTPQAAVPINEPGGGITVPRSK